MDLLGSTILGNIHMFLEVENWRWHADFLLEEEL